MTPVHVITRDVDSDDAGIHVVIDHDNYNHREWLGRHVYWAFRNGRSITTYPTDERITFVEKFI